MNAATTFVGMYVVSFYIADVSFAYFFIAIFWTCFFNQLMANCLINLKVILVNCMLGKGIIIQYSIIIVDLLGFSILKKQCYDKFFQFYCLTLLHSVVSFTAVHILFRIII
jgi:hypothetical protein